jgi:hypothetical protein
MTAPPPILLAYDGETFTPVHRRIADKHFVVGENYLFEVYHPRSMKSHNAYFAVLHEAWLNLPEDQDFKTEKHLRKWALIKAGYADERSIVCASAAEARRVAAFIAPMDEYAIVTVKAATIRVYTAQSQSIPAMGAKDFQASKEKVLEIVAGLVGLPAADLSREAGAAA